LGSRDPRERTANQFFAALDALCAEELPLPSIVHLPRSRSTVRTAIDSLRDDHADATIERAARRAGTSTRTSRRKLHDELRTSFREFFAQTRLMRALE
jgi:transcriptional regulator GlxA family with amidase domain